MTVSHRALFLDREHRLSAGHPGRCSGPYPPNTRIKGAVLIPTRWRPLAYLAGPIFDLCGLCALRRDGFVAVRSKKIRKKVLSAARSGDRMTTEATERSLSRQNRISKYPAHVRETSENISEPIPSQLKELHFGCGRQAVNRKAKAAEKASALYYRVQR